MQEVISDDFKVPMGACPELRASLVPRWSIIKMAREQSVAEHQYNVAILVRWLCDNCLCMDEHDTLSLVEDALLHDMAEVKTGDIPSPAKVETNDRPTDPIIKLADVMEAYIFARDNCNDTKEMRMWLLGGLWSKIAKLLKENKITRKDIFPLIGDK